MVFAPLTAILIEYYGWKGTHLAFGVFCLGSLVFAALMGPLDFKCFTNRKEEEAIKNVCYIIMYKIY